MFHKHAFQDNIDFTPTFGASHGTAVVHTKYFSEYFWCENLVHCMVKYKLTYSNAHNYTTMTLPVPVITGRVGDHNLGQALKGSASGYQLCYCLALGANATSLYANRYDGSTALPFPSGVHLFACDLIYVGNRG